MSEFTDELRDLANYDWYNDDDTWIMYMEDAHSTTKNCLDSMYRILDGLSHGDGRVSMAEVAAAIEEVFGGELDTSEGE